MSLSCPGKLRTRCDDSRLVGSLSLSWSWVGANGWSFVLLSKVFETFSANETSQEPCLCLHEITLVLSRRNHKRYESFVARFDKTRRFPDKNPFSLAKLWSYCSRPLWPSLCLRVSIPQSIWSLLRDPSTYTNSTKWLTVFSDFLSVLDVLSAPKLA